MQNFHASSLEEFTNWCQEKGEKPFRAKQIWDWVYQKMISSWDAMTNVSLSFRKDLAENFVLRSIDLERIQESKDGQTVKFLWKLHDEKFVESVLIFAPGRQTVCVSSQVGCPARCAFCASGKEGLIRNLSRVEIFEQVYHIEHWLIQRGKGERVSNIVYMGMGEPLENYEEVMGSISALCDPLKLHFSDRKITVSTVGVVEGIHRMIEENSKVNLVLSLHAPNQNIRKKIIPYARKYPLEDVLAAMRKYASTTKRDITYEYTLLDGINDKEEHALELAALVQADPCTVNLIPYNPVEGLHLQRPAGEAIEKFREVLESKKIVVTWRYTKGKDIAAACGQLALQKNISLGVI
jgi:23S rRNA (adenine2503-C2)-methyltransferase